eukprot:TRINITY_DN31716_c0_g1_i1.p1 TRINITY_DN31716_c0_g1~~TRINITY_DN31716_c0_g1_i1.p1  ORF type:complete len:668 (-),score=119.72 TRINITY_DN31716_c0_g1_i1:155-2077(-)
MEGVHESLSRCASLHGSADAAAVLEQWSEDLDAEDRLGTSLFTLAAVAVRGATLEAQVDAAVGVERCLAAATTLLSPDAVGRLQRSTVERTLGRLDGTSEALAARASSVLLWPGATISEVTLPLRTLLSLLLRCNGAERLSGVELLELSQGDVALAVAVVAESLGVTQPAGLERWQLQMARMLHQLTTPEVFGWLLQNAAAGEDFNAVPMHNLHERRTAHCRVLALSFVQFEVIDRVLLAAEAAAHREALIVFLFRALHNVVGDRGLVEAGRMLSRTLALDFMRLAFRFLAPLVRRLVDNKSSPAQVRVLRLICSTLSWLLVHAEADGSGMLRESLRPLAAEWALRALSRSDLSTDGLAALVSLAANCGCLAAPEDNALKIAPQLRAAVEGNVDRLRERLEGDARRSRNLTTAGCACFWELGLTLPAGDDFDSEVVDEWPDDGDAEYPSWEMVDWAPGAAQDDLCQEPAGFEPGCVVGGCSMVELEHPVPCAECGAPSKVGSHGEGYFEGCWYCSRCWSAWDQATPELVTLSPWQELDGGEAPLPAASHQRGAGALLTRAPDWLRCGVSGRLLTQAAVRIPGATQQPVAFDRRSLERWHRRSGGKCPITGQSLDLLRQAVDAPDVPGAVRAWLQQEFGRG